MEFSIFSLQTFIKIFDNIVLKAFIMIFGNLFFLKACNFIFMSLRCWIFVEVYLFEWKYLQCVEFRAYKRVRIIIILYGY